MLMLLHAKVNVTVETDIVQAIANGIACVLSHPWLNLLRWYRSAQRIVGKDGPHDLDLFTKVTTKQLETLMQSGY